MTPAVNYYMARTAERNRAQTHHQIPTRAASRRARWTLIGAIAVSMVAAGVIHLLG